MLIVNNLVKTYQTTKSKKKNRYKALNDISIEFPEKGLVFILGKSGCGKSTLLNCIGGLDTFDKGEIIIKGKSSKDFSKQDFDSYRNTFIGFIFQEYNILENFTVAKNIEFAIELQGKKPNKEMVENLLKQVDLIDYAKRKPNQLSGGQKQRVAIARALIKNPEIIMADEPTGALDSTTGKQVMETLKELSKNKLVIIVSHDREFAETYGDRIIELKDGKVLADETKKQVCAEKTESGISVVDGEYIHIKKGQRYTNKDIELIVKSIVKNSKESDTIISLADDKNKQIKKITKINDEGNQETFAETLKEDIKSKDYDGKKLKFIKSKLKWHDSFKIGASALKHKTSKLFFTILLSVFAFTCFGIIDAFTSWNRVDSVNDAIEITNPTSLTLKKRIKGNNRFLELPISETDVNEFNTNFSDYEFSPVYSFGQETQIHINGLSVDSNVYSYYGCFAYGFMNIKDNNVLNKFNLNLTGNLPSNDNEICISKHIFECLKNSNDSITNFDSIKDREINFSGISGYYKIVGLIDDGSDYSKYKDIQAESINGSNYMKIQSMQNDLNYGHARMIYVTENTLEKLLCNGISNYDFEIFCENESIYWFSESYVSNEYIKSNKLELNDNEIILSYHILKNGLNCSSIAELKSLIDKGLTLKACSYYYPYNEICDLTVVGFADDYNYIANQNTINLLETASYIKLKVNEEEIGNFSSSSLTKLEDHIIYNKNTNTTLKKNQVILSKNNLSNLFDNEQDMRNAINDGLNVKIRSYDNTQLLELEVVGITSLNSPIFGKETNDYINNLLFHGYSFIITSLKDGNNSALIKFCETENEGYYFNIYNDATPILDSFSEIIKTTTTYFIWVALGFAVFASLIFMNYISTSISYKKREIGILRALGARSKDVFGIFFNESLIISFINFVISGILTFVLCMIINTAIIGGIGLSLTLLNASIRQFILILAISLASAFISCLIPVLQISHKKPIDAINNR